MTSLRELADESFVSLTTFRRSGEGVATTVWVTADPDGDGLLVMTIDGSGKVKRIRNDPRVTLRPCGRLGKVDEDAPTVEATASVGAFTERIEQAFKDKYGAEFSIVRGVERVTSSKPRVTLRLSAAALAGP